MTSLEDSLASSDRVRQTRAALTCMNLAHRCSAAFIDEINAKVRKALALVERFRRLRDALGTLVCGNDLPVAMMAAWALAWAGAARLPNTPPSRDVFLSLYRLWRTQSGQISRFASWAFETQPLFPRDTFRESDFTQAAAAIDPRSMKFDTDLLVLCWYRRQPWSDAELLGKLIELPASSNPTIFELARKLGTGDHVFDRLVKKHPFGRKIVELLDVALAETTESSSISSRRRAVQAVRALNE